MGKEIHLCFSSFQFVRSTSSEDSTGSGRCLTGGSFLGDTELLHNYFGDVNPRSFYHLSRPEHSEITFNGEKTSSTEQTTSNAVTYIRKSYESKQLSEKSIDIIMASWRQSTMKQYSTYINRWISFCDERKIDTFQTPIEFVIEFLTELYESGLSYESLNSARSSLSNLCNKQDGYTVGSHPLVTRFMTGVFNLRPSQPKYLQTWDVNVVLHYLKTLSPVEDLSLKLLTYKLVMLVALTQASRTQSISFLSLQGMKIDSKSIVMFYSGLLKQCRKGKVNPFVQFHMYMQDSDICVYKTLSHYIHCTSSLRGLEKNLFVNYVKPYKRVVSTTISRWIKCVLRNSGIDIEKYTSHSTRSAIS